MMRDDSRLQMAQFAMLTLGFDQPFATIREDDGMIVVDAVAPDGSDAHYEGKLPSDILDRAEADVQRIERQYAAGHLDS